MKNHSITKRIRPWWGVLGLVLGLSAQAQTNLAGTPPLTGKVVDASGQPLAGVAVELYQYDRSRAFEPGDLEMREHATTGTNGGFEFHVSRSPGWLVARKPGLALAWKQITPASGAEARLIMTPPTVLAGLVVDEADKPVGGVEVYVAAAFNSTEEGGRQVSSYLTGKPARRAFTVRTTAEGRFRIEGFPTDASASLMVQAPGMALRQSRQERLNPSLMHCRAGQEDVRLVLEPAGAVEGQIVFEGASQPLPVARLFLQPDGPGVVGLPTLEPAKSQADGAFRMTNVAAGSYFIRAVFGTNAAAEWVAGRVFVSVEKGQTTRGVQVEASRGALLEVLVLGKKDRQPLPGVSVSVYKNAFQAGATSDSNGVAALRLLPGDYQVSAYKEGWRSENLTASVDTGKTNHLELETTPPPRLTGIVRRPDGQPAANLPVRIVGEYSSTNVKAETDAQGRFEVEWNSSRSGPNNNSSCLFIQDAARNLAVAEDIDEETGPLDLRLAPGLTLAGRAECDGKPVANISAALVFWTGNSGMHLYGLSTGTNIPGHFEIGALPPGRRYGLYVSAPGYGQRYINEVDASEARRIELDPVELKPANLKLAGKVVDADDKPVAGVNVNLSGEGQPNANVRTDRNGGFAFDKVCEGMVRLSASAMRSYGNISAEGGDTNVVLRLGESYSTSPSATPRKLKGLVTDPDGKPVAGAQVAVFPRSGSSRWIKTATNGSYSLGWTMESWQMQSGNPSLIVRELARNLAAAEEISEEATNLDVQLKPALTVTGRVEDSAGAPLTNAEVGVWLKTGNSYNQLSEQFTAPDAQGRFEIKSLPVDGQYRVFAKAKGHGKSEQEVELDAETNRVELPAFVLHLADRALAGQVLGMNDKPSPGVFVSLSGENQPDGSLTTDSKGRFSFKVCEGQVRLYASGQDSYANLTAEAGDTNVIIQLRGYNSSSRPAATRSLLKGKPLPDLAAIGLVPEAIPAGRPLLLCLFDCEQRSSRRCLRLLAEQYDALAKKGLAVAAVQAAATAAESFKTWQQASPMPFPLGRITEKTTTTKWASEMETMPCLILTDKERKVVAEGFAVDDLEEKVKALNK